MFQQFNRQFYRNYYFYSGIFWTLMIIKQEFYRSAFGALMCLLVLLHYYYAFFRPKYNFEENWKLALVIGFTFIFVVFILWR